MSLLNKASLIMTPNAVKQSKVYSIIPSNGNGDFTFTRGTPASSTLNNVSGLIETVPYNLLAFSEQFNDSVWIKNASTITPNVINSPNGTLTADKLNEDTTTTSHRVYQSTSNSAIGTVTFSIYAKAGERNWLRLAVFDGGTSKYCFFNLTNGTIGTSTGLISQSITSVGNGWYRCTITGDVIVTNIQSQVYIALSDNGFGYLGDGTSGLYLWGAQTVQGSVPKDYFFTTDRFNVPRLNYDTAGGCPSLLLEPQRTNLLLNSVWAGGGSLPTSWIAFSISGTSTSISSIKNPNVTAYRFITTSAQRQDIGQNFIFALNSINCLSVYVESVDTAIPINQMIRISAITGTGTSVFLKNNVVISGATNIESGNTYTLQFTCTLSDTFSARVGSGVTTAISGNFVLSMPQLELGAYATSYIPTTTGTVTRIADTMSRNNIFTNGLITSAGGTWFVELNNNLPLIRDNAISSIIFADNTSTNTFFLRADFVTSERICILKRVGNSPLLLFTTTANTCKIAIKWNGSTADVFVNGVKVISATIFTSTNLESIISQGLNITLNIKSMLLFPTPLTDSECIALTSFTNYISYENMAINLNYVIQ